MRGRQDVLLLYGLPALLDLLSDVLDFDHGIRLHDTQEILLQQGVVERGEVSSYRDVRREF